MKRAPLCFLLLSLALALALAPLARGQGESYAAIKATTKYLDGGMKSSTVVDPESRTAVETLMDKQDRVLKKTTFLLDENNLALGAIHYDAKGNVRYKETFARDPAGHVVEAKFTGPEGQPLGRRVFNFNGDKFVGGVDYDANNQVITPKTTTTTTTRPVKKK
jgi:hypothetical protein